MSGAFYFVTKVKVITPIDFIYSQVDENES